MGPFREMSPSSSKHSRSFNTWQKKAVSAGFGSIVHIRLTQVRLPVYTPQALWRSTFGLALLARTCGVSPHTRQNSELFQCDLWCPQIKKYPTTITCYQITNLDVHPTKSDRCWSTPIHRNCYDWVIRRPLPSPRQGRHLGPPEVWNLLLSAYNAYKSSWHAQPRRQQAPQGQINGFSWAFKPAVCEPFNA